MGFSTGSRPCWLPDVNLYWAEKECMNAFDIPMSTTAMQRPQRCLHLLEEPGWGSESLVHFFRLCFVCCELVNGCLILYFLFHFIYKFFWQLYCYFYNYNDFTVFLSWSSSFHLSFDMRIVGIPSKCIANFQKFRKKSEIMHVSILYSAIIGLRSSTKTVVGTNFQGGFHCLIRRTKDMTQWKSSHNKTKLKGKTEKLM